MAGLRGAQEAGGQEGVSPGQGLLCGPETRVQGLLGEFPRPRPSRAESPRPLSAAEGLLAARGQCLQWHPVGSRSGVHKGLRPSHLWALVLNTQQLPTSARAPRCYLPTEAAGGRPRCSHCRRLLFLRVHFSEGRAGLPLSPAVLLRLGYSC